jgi:hypothetical protein
MVGLPKPQLSIYLFNNYCKNYVLFFFPHFFLNVNNFTLSNTYPIIILGLFRNRSSMAKQNFCIHLYRLKKLWKPSVRIFSNMNSTSRISKQAQVTLGLIMLLLILLCNEIFICKFMI